MLVMLWVGIWMFTVTWGLIGMISYWRQVLPTLERRGFKPYWPVGPSGQWRQTEEYGRICREEGLPLRSYRLLRWFHFIGPVLVLALAVVALLDWHQKGG